MSENESEIVDAEIVELPNLPAFAAVAEELSNCEPIKLPNRQDTLLDNRPERRCVAHKKNGDRCRKFAIEGATVCRVHGGASGHVRRAAKARLDNAADLMAQKLLGIAIDDSLPAETRLKAIKDALDRSMGRPTATVEVGPIEPKPWEEIFDAIGGSPTRDYDAEQSLPPAMAGPMHDSTRQPGRGAVESGHPNAASAESLEALRRSANRTGLGSDATGQFASSSPAGQRTEGDASARLAGGDDIDRERQPQDAGAPTSGSGTRQHPGLVGEAALAEHARLVRKQIAIGALRPPKELESPHKRYRNPYDV
ncbi:hypothetical protein [Mycolicibacterium llatzerense]|uniref:hypothetical protein n=1 Tax=Mycolicibacterium llatzerense TaxID=280871 RepID=UPI0021B5E6AA|nr:hypothetical protein [Mycolicibacterium llatzerense]MCT7365936.1 hypothetical protein [Mycolicibacterium llatzerense]